MISVAKILFRRQHVRLFSKIRNPMVCEEQKPPLSPKIKKLKDLQKKFSADDGVPVYLKAGTRDKILFQISVGGVGVGLVMALHVLYILIVPGKRLEWLKNQEPEEETDEEAAE